MRNDEKRTRGKHRKDVVLEDGTFLGEGSEENRYHLRPAPSEPKPLTLVGSTGNPTYGTLLAVLMVDKKLTPSAKVLWTYLHFRQGKNDTAWPSQATIKAHTNISRSTIQRATIDLEALGWLIVFRTKMGTQRWNSYRVRIPKYAEDKINSGSKKKRSSHQKEQTSDSNTGMGLIQNDAVKTPIKTLNKNTSTTTHQSRLVPDLSNFFKTVND
jgi:hypothetical protein